MQTSSRGLEQPSPFRLEDELIRFAKEEAARKPTALKFLNAGRGNPKSAATMPRAAFFRLGEFALVESKRVCNEPHLGGMPRRPGIAERFRAFLTTAGPGPGARLLRRGLEYGVQTLGFDADAFVHELADAAIGADYPEPDRRLPHAERVVRCYLEKAVDGRPPPLADRGVAFKHTAGLSPPQQAQMTLFALSALLDCKAIGRALKSIAAAAVDEWHAAQGGGH